MWTAENRRRYERKGRRYPSDLTDEEWALVEPHLPPARRTDRREILNAILYVLSTGCQWRALPKDFLPKSTVHDYFIEWHRDGTLTRIHLELYAGARELAGKQPTATTASQSVKSAEKGGPKSTRPATMRARKSRARSATSLSIRLA